jgi:hypothetical protein
MDIFIDLHQYSRISQAQSDATTAKHKAEKTEDRVSCLERRVDRLSLAAQALWEILRDQFAITDQQVIDKMAQIDMRDGLADGKIHTQVIKCASCGRPINSKRPTCVYCGTLNRTDHIVQ